MTNGCLPTFKLVAIVQIWTFRLWRMDVKTVSNAAHSSLCGVKVKPVSEQAAKL